MCRISNENIGYNGGLSLKQCINPTSWVNNIQLHESISYSNVRIAFHGPVVNSIAWSIPRQHNQLTSYHSVYCKKNPGKEKVEHTTEWLYNLRQLEREQCLHHEGEPSASVEQALTERKLMPVLSLKVWWWEILSFVHSLMNITVQ